MKNKIEYATTEEQQILSKYVGWGGLKSAFEDNNDSWASEYAELKDYLLKMNIKMLDNRV